jgi:hypothetical protein
MIYELSGSQFLFSGVGTQMTTAWHLIICEKSVLAMKRPARTSSATLAEEMWWIKLSPR